MLHKVNERPSPAVASPTGYPSARTDHLPSGTLRVTTDPWWRGLQDANLDDLMREALAKNFTVAQAAARVRRARASAGYRGSSLVPSLDLSGVANVLEPGGSAVEVAGMVSWEIDLFGRLGSRDRAVAQTVMASENELGAARLTLTADLAQAYYSAAEHRMLLDLLAQQRRLATRVLRTLEAKAGEGARSSPDVSRQRAQVLGLEAMIPQARAALHLDENRLDVLLGRPIDGADRIAIDTLPSLPGVPAVGVPADLLVHRPDLRVLRHRLVAADHDIATAIAERLPRIELTGSLVGASSPTGVATSVLAKLVAPLMEWNSRENAVRERRGAHAEALAAFTSAYLEALSEVDGLLYQERCKREEIVLLERQIDEYKESAAAARRRPLRGRGNALPLISAVESLQTAERALLTRRRELVSLRITLHRALGGRLTAAGRRLPRPDSRRRGRLRHRGVGLGEPLRPGRPGRSAGQPALPAPVARPLPVALRDDAARPRPAAGRPARSRPHVDRARRSALNLRVAF